MVMEEISISEFKAKCLAIVERVRKTKRPVCITRHGKPVAELMPPSLPRKQRDWIGSMEGKIEITGDILSPVIAMNDFEAWRE
jgi:prevent-host-death family protein